MQAAQSHSAGTDLLADPSLFLALPGGFPNLLRHCRAHAVFHIAILVSAGVWGPLNG